LFPISQIRIEKNVSAEPPYYSYSSWALVWNLHGWVLCDLSTLAFIRNDRGVAIGFEESFFWIWKQQQLVVIVRFMMDFFLDFMGLQRLIRSD